MWQRPGRQLRANPFEVGIVDTRFQRLRQCVAQRVHRHRPILLVAHDMRELEALASLGKRADKIHDGIGKTPREIAPESGEEHFVPCCFASIDRFHGTNKRQGHEKAKAQLADAIDGIEDLSSPFGFGVFSGCRSAH